MLGSTAIASAHSLWTLGENYHYVHTDKLSKGTHILEATYKPTHWTKKADDKWEMSKTRKDFLDAKECELYAMQGKSFVMIDDACDQTDGQ